MSEEDRKLKKHLVDEMMKVSETNPDVMIYMQALMEKYEELEQDNINIKQQLLENKISLKDVEYQEKVNLQQKVEQLEKELQTTANKCKQLENIRKEAIKFILQNCEIIRHEKENVDEVGRVNGADLLNILNKGDNNGK